MDAKLKETLKAFAKGSGKLCVLTGAGISAESGIPTFRGPEGYWTVGSKVYHPQEMATHHMFVRHPEAVWQWYLYRLGVCRKAAPNPGHRAIAQLEALFADRFTLITQNVDGLHLRAGNSPERTYQVHGNIFFMRCAKACTQAPFPMPQEVPLKEKDDPLTPEDLRLLRCPGCGGMARPHVLWFDETYNEAHYRFFSSLKAARETDLLITVGTSGATNLPNQVVSEALRRGAVMVDVNVEENPFGRAALSSSRGFFLKGKSGVVLPEMVELFRMGL